MKFISFLHNNEEKFGILNNQTVTDLTGKISNSNPLGGVYSSGQDANDISQVHIPYAFKLLLQELTSMGISSK